MATEEQTMRFKLLNLVVGLLITTQSVTVRANIVTPREVASETTREVFGCTLLISNEYRDGRARRNFVDIATPQPTVLGVGDNEFDLQPVFDSEAIGQEYFGHVRILGAIYHDEQGVKKVKLGIYRTEMNRSGYTSDTHHIMASANGRSSYYSHPLSEVKLNYVPHGDYDLETTGITTSSTEASYIVVKCTHQQSLN